MLKVISIILIIFFIGLIFVIFVTNSLYKNTNDYRNGIIDIKNYENGIPDNLKIINLGSTYSKYAFGTYDQLNILGCDMSLQSQGLSYDYAILKQYKDHLSKDAFVIIVVAACCMMYEGNANNLLYYHILDRKQNPNYKFINKIKNYFPILVHPKKIKKIISDSLPYYDVYDTLTKEINTYTSEQILNNMVNVWIKIFNLKDLKSIDISSQNINTINKNIETLKNMIEFCEEEKINPIIVVPPFSDKLNQYFSKEFTQKIVSDCVKKAINHKNVPFLNYQWDEYFKDKYNLFIDGGFRLNKYGSKIFFNRLVSDLNQKGLKLNNKTIGGDELKYDKKNT